MSRKKWLIAVVLLAVLAAYLAGNQLFGKKEVTIEQLELMQLEPAQDYFQTLTATIKENTDLYVRERAVYTLTEISISKNETQPVIDFLKRIASSEKDENVRTAAYANIDFIKNVYPPEKKGKMDLSIAGAIRKGGNITLIANVSSAVDVEKAIVGINKLHTSIKLSTEPVVKIDLKAGRPERIEFNLTLKENGKYYIPVTFTISLDRVEYETTQKRVYITVDETGGEVNRIE